MALIFDMDGVLVDNSLFHKRAWKFFCWQHGFRLTEDQLRQHVYGRTNKNILTYLFGTLSKKKILNYAAEKEEIYRKLFSPHFAPVRGIERLFHDLRKHHVLRGLATSAPPINVAYVLRKMGLRRFFKTIVDDTMVQHGKPHPEVYLKTAQKLGVDPVHCVVFEDAVSGVQAAKAAGMHVIAVTTTHSRRELREADIIIPDFTRLSFERVKHLSRS